MGPQGEYVGEGEGDADCVEAQQLHALHHRRDLHPQAVGRVQNRPWVRLQDYSLFWYFALFEAWSIEFSAKLQKGS